MANPTVIARKTDYALCSQCRNFSKWPIPTYLRESLYFDPQIWPPYVSPSREPMSCTRSTLFHLPAINEFIHNWVPVDSSCTQFTTAVLSAFEWPNANLIIKETRVAFGSDSGGHSQWMGITRIQKCWCFPAAILKGENNFKYNLKVRFLLCLMVILFNS